MNIPVCCVTGRIAGDGFACGDCDACDVADKVPDVVKRLIKERDEWADKYVNAMMDLEELRPAPNPDGFDLSAPDPATDHPALNWELSEKTKDQIAEIERHIVR